MVRLLTITALFLSLSTSHALGCRQLFNNLYSCKPYTCTEFNPLIPYSLMRHTVVSLKEDKCIYRQEAYTGTLNCAYSEPTRKRILELRTLFAEEHQIRNQMLFFPNTEQELDLPDQFVDTSDLLEECSFTPGRLLPNRKVYIEDHTKYLPYEEFKP